MQLAIHNILKHSYFKGAKIAAGQEGLNRPVRWVHILEISQIGQLLNGNELILSTGVGWSQSDALGSQFLQQLIDKKASGLCVELGTYITTLPEGMIQLADRHQFPLIVFENEVRFIDITQDINGNLMETHYKMMSDLEEFSNKLNHLQLTSNAFMGILRLFHDYLNTQIIYRPVEGDPYFIPSVNPSKRTELLNLIDTSVPSKLIASQPIQAMGHLFANLYIINQNQEWTEYDFLVLDRTAIALAQDQLRALYVEEKRKSNEHYWVQKWLNGDHSKRDIEHYLLSLKPNLKLNGGVICLCQLDMSDDDIDLTYYSMFLRSVFEQFNFFPLVSQDRRILIFALVNHGDLHTWKERLRNSLHQIENTELFQHKRFGVGKLFDSLDHIQESYRMAREVLYVQENRKKSDKVFYEELYIYRLISYLNSKGALEAFIEDYLEPVLQYDRCHKGQLFETLKVFLEVNGSKNEAAKRLYVVRQTLYHRIEKLKELLGSDFMEPEKRLAIEIAVHSSKFVK